jgi:hypothetical protein
MWGSARYSSGMRSGGSLSEKGGRYPNFLIIGAAKSGTTSLNHYLGQHPDIFMSPDKEPGFFAWEGKNKEDVHGPGTQQAFESAVTEVDAYRSLFNDASHQRIVGEASTEYLYSPTAPARIRHHIPEAKLIAILRNPIDRAFSAYLHARRERHEPLSDLEEALAAEQSRIRDGWDLTVHYSEMGMYAQQLENYLVHFPSDQLRLYLYDDLARDPVAVVQDALLFLNVDPAFEPDISRRLNKAKVVRSARGHVLLHSPRIRSLAGYLFPARLRHSLYRKLRRWNQLPVPSFPPKLRGNLARIFEVEIHTLSRMVGRDLSPWLENGTVRSPQPGVSLGMNARSGSDSQNSAARHGLSV